MKECNTRKDKLLRLRHYMDLETHQIYEDKYPGKAFRNKILRKNLLDRKLNRCHLCEGMNITSSTGCVPGWGNINASIFIIGEAPCTKSMIYKYPFAWKSGIILDLILKLSNLTRNNIFITNSIHCHPPSNRTPLYKEILNCSAYLQKEIKIVKPKLIIALGNTAKLAMLNINIKDVDYRIIYKKHPASFLYSSEGIISYIIKTSLEIDKYK